MIDRGLESLGASEVDASDVDTSTVASAGASLPASVLPPSEIEASVAPPSESVVTGQDATFVPTAVAMHAPPAIGSDTLASNPWVLKVKVQASPFGQLRVMSHPMSRPVQPPPVAPPVLNEPPPDGTAV